MQRMIAAIMERVDIGISMCVCSFMPLLFEGKKVVKEYNSEHAMSYKIA